MPIKLLAPTSDLGCITLKEKLPDRVGYQLNLQVLALLVILLTTSFSLPVLATSCREQSVGIQVLGSGGPELDDGRTSSSYLLKRGNDALLLLDVGSGSSINFGKVAGADFATVGAILLSHLHTDHSAGLPAFIKGSFFGNRQRDLTILGPGAGGRVPGTALFVERLFGSAGAFSYLQDYLVDGAEAYRIITFDAPVKPASSKTFELGDNIRATSLSVHHGPIPAVAWRIDAFGCRVTYAGDTNNRAGNLASFAKGSDLLIVHNAIPSFAGRVARNLHIGPEAIIELAQAANARAILVSHFMRRTLPHQQSLYEKLAQHYSGQVYFAEDMMSIGLGDSQQ